MHKYFGLLTTLSCFVLMTMLWGCCTTSTKVVVEQEEGNPFLANGYVTDVNYESPLRYFDSYDVSSAGKLILVDVSKQRLWALEDGVIKAYFITSTGNPDATPTLPGNYTIGRRLIHGQSITYEGDKWWGMDWFLELIDHNGCPRGGIHDVPSLWDKYQDPIEGLGTPLSHKCVRLGHVPLQTLGDKSPAQWLFDWACEKDNPCKKVKIVGTYRAETAPESDHSSCRRFSPEFGFYLEG